MESAIDRAGINEFLGLNGVLASIREIFAANLERLMEERGIRQTELATRLGVAKSVISHWKNGSRFPEAKYLDALATALHVSPSELFREPSVTLPVSERDIDSILRELAGSRGYDLIKKK